MTTSQKQTEVNEMTNKLNYKGATLLISNNGRIYDEEGNELKQKTIANKRTGHVNPYLYVNVKYDGKTHNVQVSRLVCMAFHPIENPEMYQCDHRDNNPKNNVSSNLRWVSRKFNNSRKHTRMMKSQNYKRTSHSNEFLRAENVKTGEVKYFKSGMEAAKFIGCSHVLIYNVIAGKFANTAKGWKVSWISRDAEEVQEFKRELELKMMQRELLEAKKKLDAKEAKKKLRAELRRFTEELKRKRKDARKRELEAIEDATQSEIHDIRERTKADIRRMDEQHKAEMRQLVWDRHAILQYTIEGEFIREWRCVSDAQKATGINNINKCVKGIQEQAGGFIWKYKVER